MRLGLVVLAEPADEHAAHDADLGRSQPDPARVVHQAEHPRGQAPQVVVEGLDLGRRHAQRRVWVLADLGEREPPPRLLLRISLLARLLLDDLSVLLRHGGQFTFAPDAGRPPAQRPVGAAAASGTASSGATPTRKRRAQTTAPTNATAAPRIAAECMPAT